MGRPVRQMPSLSDDDIQSDVTSQLMTLCGVSVKEQNLRDQILDYINLMAFRVAQGHTVTYDDAYRDINQIAEEHGYLSGVPIPVLGECPPDLVMARGVPLAEVFHMNQELRAYERVTELAAHLDMNSISVRNSWHQLGDMEIAVIDTEEGPKVWPR